MTEPVERLCYRVPSVLAVLDMKKSKFYEEVKAGKIIARKRGGETVVTADDLKAYVDSLPKIEVAA